MRFLASWLLLASSLMLAQANPVPFLNQPLVPTATTPGGPAFTLTVNGTGFVSGSVVNWNGAVLSTTFVNSSQLTATVPASNIAQASTAFITVFSPSPGGGTSNVEFFEVSAPTDLKFTSVPITPAGTGDCVSVGYLQDCANFVAADFTGNGKLDLIYGSFMSEGAVVFGSGFTSLGNGDGTFQAPISWGSQQFTFFVTADINGDGKLDLVELQQGNQVEQFPYTLWLSLGNGNGTFSTPVQFASGTSISNIDASDPVVADFNGDGKLDVAFTDGLGMEVYLGNGDGTFQPVLTSSVGAVGAAGPFASLVVGDFNGDGKLDIAEIWSPNGAVNGQLQILLGNGNGTFTSGASYSTLPNPGLIYAADFNGHNKLDLLFFGGNGAPYSMVVMLGNGDGTFGTGSVYPTNNAGTIGGAAITDLNADGKLDVVLANSLGAAIASTAIMLGNGDGTFQSPLVLPFFASATIAPNTIAAGDFNNDGKMDLAVWTGNGIAALLQDYAPDFSLAASSPSSVTITPGQTAKYTISVAPGAGFTQTVSFTCSGAPAQSTCTVSPTSVTLDGIHTAQVTVGVATAGAMALTQPAGAPFNRGGFGVSIALSGFLGLAILATLSGGYRGRTSKIIYAVTLIGVLSVGMAMSACGGGGSGGNSGGGTPAGTYALTVTGTSTSGSTTLTHTVNLSLVVQ